MTERDTSGYKRIELPRVVPDPDNPDHGYKAARPPRQAGLQGRFGGMRDGMASEWAQRITRANYDGIDE